MRYLLNFILSIFLLGFIEIVHAEANFTEIEQTLSDTVITTKITAKLAKNNELNPLKIKVATKNGVVHFSGHVNDKKTFVNVLRIAKDTTGVKTVDVENLTVKAVNSSLTDAYITAKVEAAILKAKVFDDESIPLVGINAKTIDGTVILSGKVKKNKSIIAIIKRVNAIRGVKKINSQLQVAKDGQ